MPVVRPHNKQKLPMNEENRPKKGKQKMTKNQQMLNKNKKTKQKKQQSDTEFESNGQQTIFAHQKYDKKRQNNKRTIKKNLLEEKPLIKDFKKRLKNYSDQYTPEYILNIIDYLIEKQKNKSIAITQDKVKKWNQIRKNQMYKENCIRKEVQRIKNLIAKAKSESKQLENQKYYSQKYIDSSQNNQLEDESFSQFYLDINKCWQDSARFNKFALLINQILVCCSDSQLQNCIFPACYFFCMLLFSDAITVRDMAKNIASNNRMQQLIQYYFSVSLFISSKYHQIQPISIQELIYDMNESLTLRKAEKIEMIALQLNGFTQFYSDHQGVYLDLMCLLVEWGELQKSICRFILQSGLNNPYLYQYSPIHKCVVVMGIYEQIFMKSQQTVRELRSIFQGPGVSLGKEIKKRYLGILEYNTLNNFNFQKQKNCIVRSDLKKLLNQCSTLEQKSKI